MATFPALPLWTDAYLADTDHLSDAEHGRYIRLLMCMWRSPDCRIPNDDEWLARKFRRPVEAVRAELRPLIAEFCQSDGNWLTQKRLLKEWRWCMAKAKKNAEAAKSMWQKRKVPSERYATTSPSGNAPTPTPTPTPQEDPLSLFPLAGEPKPNGANGHANEIQGNGARDGRGSRLPADWRGDDGDRAFAVRLGLDHGLTTDAFRDYWAAASGAKACKRDWHAAYRTWCRKAADMESDRRARQGRQGPTGIGQAAATLIRRYQERGDL